MAPSPAGGAYVITGVQPSSPHLQDAPLGPQVVHVDSQRLPTGDLVIDISFDSDLDPLSVTSATIQVTTADGTALLATVDYNPDQRVAAVHVIGAALVRSVGVTVSTGLRDVQHQALASAYTTTVSG